MAPVARELARRRGVLEPLQTRDSVEGQLEELREVVEQHGDPPVRIVGWSWGAWLAYLFAARYPSLVDKLLLVASGPFDDRFVPDIARTRLGRLTKEARAELQMIEGALADASRPDRDALLARYGALLEPADSYDPIPTDQPETSAVDFHIFERVWSEAAELRTNGALLAAGTRIQCEVVALHGDADPHPAAGVREPLQETVTRFRFILIEQCGHKPWTERAARERFFQLLENEL